MSEGFSFSTHLRYQILVVLEYILILSCSITCNNALYYPALISVVRVKVQDYYLHITYTLL